MSNQQQIKEVYKKLSQKMREIIASPELNEIVNNIAKNNNLDKRQQELLAKVIINLLAGINARENARVNISNDVGIDVVASQKIFSDIENRILNNLDQIYQEINTNQDKELWDEEWKNSDTQKSIAPKNQKVSGQNNVVQSFEQIILNQAKAMQPARNASASEAGGPAQAPSNLPTGEQEPEKRVVHDYKGEADPYREPIN